MLFVVLPRIACSYVCKKHRLPNDKSCATPLTPRDPFCLLALFLDDPGMMSHVRLGGLCFVPRFPYPLRFVHESRHLYVSQ